jgi:hypothetical protein
VITPVITGSTAAITLRNASTSSSRVSSRAMDSARTRSCWIWLLASRFTMAAPPTTTRSAGLLIVADCAATRWAVAAWVAASPVAYPRISAWRPFLDRSTGSCGWRADQYDWVAAMPRS